jgi:hypothetical protein
MPAVQRTLGRAAPSIATAGLTPAGARAGQRNGSVVGGYHTFFKAGTENPISESGAWVNNGTLWTKVQTTSGLAFGTQDGSGGFDDSFAHLSGFGADHRCRGIVKKGTTQNYQEVELLLRASSSSSSATFYECNLSHDGVYAEIVLWRGGLGSFAYMTTQGAGGPGSVSDGDVFEAQIVGNIIKTFINGTLLNTCDITNNLAGNPPAQVYNTGNPGMAFYLAGPGSLDQYGFSSYSAWTLS